MCFQNQRRPLNFFGALVLLCVVLPTAYAQQPATRLQPSQLRLAVPQQATADKQAVATTEAPASATGQPGTTAGAVTEDALKKQRQQLLQKLTFDRRASAILKAETAVLLPEKPGPDAPEKEESQADEADALQQEARKQQRELEQLRRQVEQLKRNVTLARWKEVGKFLQSLDESEQKNVYQQLLSSLVSGPPDQRKTRSGQIIGERNIIRAADVIAIAELCPEAQLSDSHLQLLGQLALLCPAEGQSSYVLSDAMAAHLQSAPQQPHKLDRNSCAKLLLLIRRYADAARFLPSVDEAISAGDTKLLELLMDVENGLYGTQQKKSSLENSWKAAQALLQSEDTTSTVRENALRHCVRLVPIIREDLGEAWLSASFTESPERGLEILTAIGSAAAKSMHEMTNSPTQRLEVLQLQQTAVQSLLQNSPERADEWRTTIHLMAGNWLREAKHSVAYDRSTQRSARMTRDVYGNYYWQDVSSQRTSVPSGLPQPIPSGKVLDVRPNDQWLQYLEEGYDSQFAIQTARLHLRVKEEAEAFPYIEQLAKTHPDDGRELVREFLDVWAENHDPNTQSRRTSIYMFSYGFNRRAAGIPLTRSRQERNLAELAKWARRIRSLPVKDIDEKWISAAFIRVHSSAEVYRLDDIQNVFGEMESITPETLAAMLQTMRTNLTGIWRKPETQQQAGTKRKKKDIEAEVIEGYKTARSLCHDALDRHPDSWQLLVVNAALQHDENDYLAQLKHTSDYAGRRRAALDAFRQAADSYVRNVAELPEEKYSVEPFQFWFYAALGASDIDQISQERQPMPKEIPQIRDALHSLPHECRQQHLAMFANEIFTRMSRVNPAVKFRYVREGLQIVGEHERAREARKVYDYYKDLVTEIKLETVLDGSPQVGCRQPFGVYVNLRHTKAIERESGGFARYLQNQNAGSAYYYNYGRPTENYREKFEQAARDALDEHFEVLSITFQPETVESRPTAESGWRTTSYAYLLLKPRGPEIDRVPPLKMDLDFLDTTGYAVLPVESQPLSVDCATTSPDPRPLKNLSIAQTLDERQISEGRLLLEVKATGQGLIPELDQILQPEFHDFEVAAIEDNGISVSRFDPESSEPVVVSDRLWTLTLVDRQEAAQNSRTFQFATARVPVEEMLWQRYDDADLVQVGQTVRLQRALDKTDYTLPIVFSALLLLIVVAAFIVWKKRHRVEVQTAETRFHIPDSPTPFNVLALLKQIGRQNGLAQERLQLLQQSISQIERYYFADDQSVDPPDLKQTAEHWVRQAR